MVVVERMALKKEEMTQQLGFLPRNLSQSWPDTVLTALVPAGTNIPKLFILKGQFKCSFINSRVL